MSRDLPPSPLPATSATVPPAARTFLSGATSSWLASLVAASIPTGAILWQMVQQAEGLRQQIVVIQAQSTVMEQQIRLEEQRQRAEADAREADLRRQVAGLVADHIDVIESGSPTAQRQLARLLTGGFPLPVVCPVVLDWIETSPSQEHWRALRSGAAACLDASPAPLAVASAARSGDAAASAGTAGGCGLLFLHHTDPADRDPAQRVAAQLRASGCAVRGPTWSARRPGVYGTSEAAVEARAEQLRSLLGRRLATVTSVVGAAEEEEEGMEIILPNL